MYIRLPRRWQRFFVGLAVRGSKVASVECYTAAPISPQLRVPVIKEQKVMRFFCQLQRAFGQVLSVSALVLLLAVTASAYTLVLRSGRRIEIPSRFVVTPTLLTYETHPGIQITLQMRAIDIPATERANNEAPGSLMRRAELVPTPPEVANQTEQRTATVAPRTITNRDLEATARRRRDSELAYGKRVKELGLPSLEESRKRAAFESELFARELEQRHVSERDPESYWRGRASGLRTEMAALDAELAFISARIDEYPFPNGTGSFSTYSSVPPLISVGNSNYGRPFPGYRTNRTSVYSSPGTGQVAGQVGVGERRGQYSRRSRRHSRNQAGVVIGGFPNVIYPNEPVFGSNVPAYDYSYERSALITRFNELGAARAGLNARWRELEEEARRAGAPPGWLRP